MFRVNSFGVFGFEDDKGGDFVQSSSLSSSSLVGLIDEEPMIFLPFFSFLAGRRRNRGFCSFFFYYFYPA
jgi:hypothetical protein